MKKIIALGAFLAVLGFSSLLFAQEGADDLFSASFDVILEGEEGPDLLEDLFEPGLKFSLSSKLKAGTLYGWSDFSQPGVHREGLSVSSVLGFGYTANADLGFFGSVEMTWPSTYGADALHVYPVLKDLYFDIDFLADRLLARAGKFSASWGSARIFKIVNLADQTDDGVSLRLTAPGRHVSFAGIATLPLDGEPVSGDADEAAEEQVSIGDISALESTAFDKAVLAGRVDLNFPFSRGGLTGHGAVRRDAAGGDTTVSAGSKLTLGGWDFFTDFKALFHGGLYNRYFNVTGFFYEIPAWKLQFYGEGQYESSYHLQEGTSIDELIADGFAADEAGVLLLLDQRRDISTSLVGRFTKLGKRNIETGLQWSHCWTDGTGELLPGFALDVPPGMRFKLGLPLVYGPDDAGSDGAYFVPGESYRLSAGILLEVSLNYKE